MSRRTELPEKLPSIGETRGERTLRKPLLLDAYVRVSHPGNRRGERFLSPRIQEETIRAFAEAHDATVERVFVELGRSGTDPHRPQLAALLARVESGASGGVIVARLDRLGRSVTGTLRLLDRINEAGGRFVSVEDGFDSHTPLGRALLTILLALAELELDRLANSTREGRSRAVRRGIHPCPCAPTGYRRGPEGRLEPDERFAPAIAIAFERRANGATYTEIAAFLAQAGVPPPPRARRWSGPCAYRLFQNPVYVGEAYSGTARNPSAHPPLVRRALWVAAHAAAARAFEDAHAGSLLGGIVRCGGCHHPLCYYPTKARSPTEPRGRPSKYACRRHFRLGDCPAPAVAAAEPLERAVVRLCLRRLGAHRPKPHLERELRAAEKRLAAIEVTAKRRECQSAVYDTDHGDTAVASARRDTLHLWRGLQLAQLPPAAEIRDSWASLSRAEQRNVLETALDAALLARGDQPVEQRLKLVFAGSRCDCTPSSAPDDAEAVAHLRRP